MKINIAVIGPAEGIGGGNRKFRIYFKYLDESMFNKFYINLADKNSTLEKKSKEEFDVSEDKLAQFMNQNNIDYIYVANNLKRNLAKGTYDELKELAPILKNVNFTGVYDPDPRVLNLIISKTDHLKIKLIHQRLGHKLVNDYVVYNPIDFELWTKLSKDKKNNFKDFFKNKKVKLIVGRMARAEPSKWEFLIVKTLLRLQKEKNYDYGFIFAGTCAFYRKFLKMTLNKKMLDNILFLPEQKKDEELARFYNSIDLFWQTSHIGESFGNVIAESFCFKVPVITDYKKFLQDDGSVASKKYDAQIEVVDHGKNGAYCNTPESIINFFRTAETTQGKAKLKKMGENGYNKVKVMYDARIAGNTLARILYDHLRKGQSGQSMKKDAKFEKIKRIPSEKETTDFYGEYVQRLNTAVRNNQMTKKEKFRYNTEKKIWTFFENIYLIIRKLLRYVKIDLEKFEVKK
jgi:glycosyltransferase involved in cell wall biosynthesis